jgi:hypothetical protein
VIVLRRRLKGVVKQELQWTTQQISTTPRGAWTVFIVFFIGPIDPRAARASLCPPQNQGTKNGITTKRRTSFWTTSIKWSSPTSEKSPTCSRCSLSSETWRGSDTP